MAPMSPPTNLPTSFLSSFTFKVNHINTPIAASGLRWVCLKMPLAELAELANKPILSVKIRNKSLSCWVAVYCGFRNKSWTRENSWSSRLFTTFHLYAANHLRVYDGFLLTPTKVRPICLSTFNLPSSSQHCHNIVTTSPQLLRPI